MKHAIGILLAACWLSGCAAGHLPDTTGPDILIANVNVVDVVAGRLLAERDVAVTSGRITGLAPHAVVQAGLTPLDALRVATIEPARYLGREDSVGTIRVGAHADLVLLRENPLSAISATRTIESVILRGRLLDREGRDCLMAGVKDEEKTDARLPQFINMSSHHPRPGPGQDPQEVITPACVCPLCVHIMKQPFTLDVLVRNLLSGSRVISRFDRRRVSDENALDGIVPQCNLDRAFRTPFGSQAADSNTKPR